MSSLQFALLSHSFPHSIPRPELKHGAPKLSLLRGIATTGIAAPRSLRSLRKRGQGAVCYALPPVSAVTLQWVSAVSSALLMLAKGTPIQKSFLVPLVALQAPESVISWIKGEYAPYQAMSLRGSQGGAIVSLAIAGYLAFQHFSRAGSLRKAFDQGGILATVAIIFITVVPCLFLFGF